MKTLIAILVLTLSSTAFAQGRGHHGHFRHHHKHWHANTHWVLPAVIGGAVVYAATRPTPIVVHQPNIVLQPNQVIIDGIVYTKQIMIINGIETEVLVRG